MTFSRMTIRGMWAVPRAALVLALGLVLTMGCSRRLAAGDSKGAITSGGLERTYLVHVPPGYPAGGPLPLVLSLHGRLSTGRQQEALSGMNAIADREGFIVAYPDGYHRGWSDGRGQSLGEQTGLDDVAFIRELIARLCADYRIDPKRIYVMGMSNGGFMSLTLACDLSDRIAGAAAVVGSMGQATAASCNPSRPVPIMIIDGDADPIVPWEGGAMKKGFATVILSAPAAAELWAKKDGCPGPPVIEDLPDADRDQVFARRELWDRCAADSQVILYRIVGGGHTWPSGPQYLPTRTIGPVCRDLDASQTIWDFFKQHPMK